MIEWVPWILFGLMTILFLVAVFAYLGKKREVERAWREHEMVSTDYEREHPYYVDSSDRLALATFIADHLPSASGHPHQRDVARILAKWGAAGDDINDE